MVQNTTFRYQIYNGINVFLQQEAKGLMADRLILKARTSSLSEIIIALI